MVQYNIILFVPIENILNIIYLKRKMYFYIINKFLLSSECIISILIKRLKHNKIPFLKPYGSRKSVWEGFVQNLISMHPDSILPVNAPEVKGQHRCVAPHWFTALLSNLCRVVLYRTLLDFHECQIHSPKW